MSTLFYDHLINWRKVSDALDALGVSSEERAEIIEYIEQTIHTEVLLVFVEALPHDRHEEFLDRFAAAPHDLAHFEFLSIYGPENVQEMVTQRTDRLIEEIIQDLTTN